MKILKSWKLLALSMLMLGGLAACSEPGPAETAGRKIDQTADAAGKTMVEAADKVGEKMGEAADKVGDKVGDAADKVGDKVGEQSDKAGVAIDDTEITTRVKASIFAEPGLRTLQISVDTIKGVVTLTGSVDTSLSVDRAGILAAAVAGVNKVDNKLVATSS
ncbi:MAG: BON domain-containing protein [Sulfuritalea sp.]|nr:BON domain-containing protein [Sulfuritalea sp.]